MKPRYRFADLHCHVLFGVDDGSGSLEESLSMLRIAAEENISMMILTPHYIPDHTMNEPEALKERFLELQEKAMAESIPVKLFLGTELFYFDGAERLVKEGAVPTLAGSDRVLIEFFTGTPSERIRDAVLSIRSEGFVPVIAHVERYVDLVTHPDESRQLKEIGAEIQINLNSACGELGNKLKSFIAGLLEERIVDYVGTDAHNLRSRSPRVQKGLAYLYRRFDEAYVREITYENTCRLTR